MKMILDLIMSNIYLYICILISLVMIVTMLSIVISNQKKRKKIKNDFIEAEKIEIELENTEPSNELESILKKMQEDIEMKPEDVVKKFEEEQEEKAIISYQELVSNVKAGKIEVEEEEDSTINFVEAMTTEVAQDSLIEIEEEPVVTPDMVKEAIDNISANSVKIEPKKFKKSEFISPIYGVINENIEYPTIKKHDNFLDIMNTRDYNELTKQIKLQEEFLEALKEFRNNL